MKVLIVYASRYGGVAECALDLQQYIDIPTDVLPVSDSSLDLAEYDIVIAGGSVHAGSIQKDLKKFLKKHREKLLQKKFAYFICCLMPDDELLEQVMPKHFPIDLQQHAFASAYPGGIVDYNKMNWFEKLIMKKITGSAESFSRKDDAKLKDFAETINNQ